VTIAEVIARPMIGAMFVYGGLDAARHPESKVAAAHGVTDALVDATGLSTTQLVRLNGVIQVGAGVAISTGILPRPAAAILALSLIPTTFAGHRFWEHDDRSERAGQTIHFLKNIGMLGGLLFAATSTGGRPSVPWRVNRAVRHAATEVGALAHVG
jgi:putative oxidoreductase